MVSQTVQVQNKIGFHARPVALLIESAKKYACNIRVTSGDITVDIRSIIDMLRLQVKMGDEVTIHADGADEEKALQEIVSIICDKFGEE